MAEADLSKIVSLIMENPKLIEEIRTIESVEPVYLETCRRLIEEKYGSFDQFFVQALGLTEEKRIRLREKYTRSAT